MMLARSQWALLIEIIALGAIGGLFVTIVTRREVEQIRRFTRSSARSSRGWYRRW